MVTWIPHLYTMPHRCRPSVVAFWQFPRWFIDDWPGKPGGLGWRSWFVYLSWNYQVKEIEKAWQIACNCTFFELLILFQGPTFSFQTHSLSFLYGHWWFHYSLAVVMLGSCLHDKNWGTNKKHPKMEFVELMLMFSSADPYLPKIIKKILSNAWGIKEPWMLGRGVKRGKNTFR